MADFPSNSQEKSDKRSPEVPVSEKTGGEAARESKEIREKSAEFIEGVSEVVESVESAEGGEGEISEAAGEDKKKGPAGRLQGTATGGAATQADVMEMPRIDVMRVQIATRIKSEIVSLEKQAKKMMNNPRKFSPFHLAQVVSKIRMLREILAGLAHATAEALKSWWLQFVKNIRS